MLKEHQNSLCSLGIWSYCDDAETYLVCGLEAPESMHDVYVERFGRSVCVGRYEELDTLLIDPFHVRRVGGGWRFRNRPAEVYGVENLNQINGFENNIEKVSKTCEDYFLRPPVAVLGWPVPIFQQPLWDLERATHAIANAESISDAEMVSMIMKRRHLGLRRANASGEQVNLAEYFYYLISVG